MTQIYVAGKPVRLDPSRSVGKGGEADVYKIGNGKVLKIYKTGTHPDYDGKPQEQAAAQERIRIHQTKLRAFPKNLPGRVVTPEELATDQSGNLIMGYTMPFLEKTVPLMLYADKTFRTGGLPSDVVVAAFQDLHGTVAGTHKAGVVVGDFNDLNVLVANQTEAHLIDADSFQFGGFLCSVFTSRFVDPLRCDPNATKLLLVRPHNEDSDWYAFTVMLMQSLLFVDPYGGVYKPKDIKKRIPHDARPLHRVTVFSPEVIYPKPAVPYGTLPDDLLQRFHLVFEKDQRGEFPLPLLQSLRWTTCSVCGTHHARAKCPTCATVAAAAVKEVVSVRGTVTANRIFKTNGVILSAAHQNGKLIWLYHERDQLKREDGSVVVNGGLDPQMRYRLKGPSTLLAKTGQVVTLTPGKPNDILMVDNYGALPIFDTNERFRYWLSNGQLLRDSPIGSEYIGDVLANQTLFWVGPKFGFGFYRAGNLGVAFVFDAEHRGINDSVKLPPIAGQITDSTCAFTGSRCWFFWTVRESGRTKNHCLVIRQDGTIEASAEAEAGDGSWLGTIRGKAAAGNFLLAATDDGVIRVEPEQGLIAETRRFPDTEPFVDSGAYLYPDSKGLYVVQDNEISLLKIS